MPNNSMWQFVPDFHSINTNNYLFLCNNTKHMIQIQHYFMIEYAHISGILKIIPTVFQCGSERGSDSAFEERLMDAEIASGPNIALLWMLGLGQVVSPILFTLLLFTSIWYHQESVIVSFQSLGQTVIPPTPRSDSKPVHARTLGGANRGRSEESFCEGNPRKLDWNPGDQKSWNPCHQFQSNQQQVLDEISNFLHQSCN